MAESQSFKELLLVLNELQVERHWEVSHAEPPISWIFGITVQNDLGLQKDPGSGK